MDYLEKKGVARLYTIEYAKMGHCYLHQFVAYTHGDLSHFAHKFLEEVKPFYIEAMNFQKVKWNHFVGDVSLFRSDCVPELI